MVGELHGGSSGRRVCQQSHRHGHTMALMAAHEEELGELVSTATPVQQAKALKPRGGEWWTSTMLVHHSRGSLWKLQDPSQRARGEINNLLIAMDYFTKWPQLYTIPNQETSEVADILVTNCTVIEARTLSHDSCRMCQCLGVCRICATSPHPFGQLGVMPCKDYREMPEEGQFSVPERFRKEGTIL